MIYIDRKTAMLCHLEELSDGSYRVRYGNGAAYAIGATLVETRYRRITRRELQLIAESPLEAAVARISDIECDHPRTRVKMTIEKDGSRTYVCQQCGGVVE